MSDKKVDRSVNAGRSVPPYIDRSIKPGRDTFGGRMMPVEKKPIKK